MGGGGGGASSGAATAHAVRPSTSKIAGNRILSYLFLSSCMA
jgi:hypothetical protein